MLSRKKLKIILENEAKKLLKKWIDLLKKIEVKQKELISQIEDKNISWGLDQGIGPKINRIQ